MSCGGTDKYRPNIITLAWAGTVCSEPPMVSISIRPQRYSYEIISETREFVLNLTTEELARATDWCGVKSGRDVNKFKLMGLTPEKSQLLEAPLVAESPLSIECKVVEVRELGSHDMFIANVVAVDAEEKLIDPTTGAFQLNHAHPMAYSHGKYYALGEKIGSFGFSVKKRR